MVDVRGPKGHVSGEDVRRGQKVWLPPKTARLKRRHHEIEFPPHNLSPAAQAQIKSAIPEGSTTCPHNWEAEECELHELVDKDPVASFKASDFPNPDDEDDQDLEGGGAQRVQCAQQ